MCCGLALASLLPLLLNVHKLEYPAMLFMILGGVIASPLARQELSPHPIFLMGANAIFYAVSIFGLLNFWGQLRAMATRIPLWNYAVTAAVLFGLACVPAFNPLWPSGLAELRAQKVKLERVIDSNMTADEVAAALAKKSVLLSHHAVARSAENVGDGIAASPGDSVLIGKLQTKAVQYPCGYQLRVVVVFGPDGKMKNHLVTSQPVCP